MRKAFSMVELIFVIVLMGILAYVGSGFLPDNKLFEYTSKAIMKIKETQKNAIGYDVNGFGKPWSNVDYNTTCIKLDKKSLLETGSNLVKVTHPSWINKICFDEYGRPYQSKHLLLSVVDINITKDSQIRELKLFPMSGYVIINY